MLYTLVASCEKNGINPGGLPDGRAHPRAAPPGPPHRGAPASPLEAARRCAFLRTPGISGGLGRRASAARRPTSGLTSAASCEPHDALPRNNSLAVYSWTVTIRNDKRGHIDGSLPPIIARLNIDPSAWEAAMQPRGNVFGRAMGRLNHLQLHAKALGQSWVRGLRKAELLYR